MEHPLEPGEEPTGEPVAQPVQKRQHRVCTGARLGNKRYEVEAMLLRGESKSRIARYLQISQGSVRAVEKDLKANSYAPGSGDEATSTVNIPSLEPATPEQLQNIPDRLRAVAMSAVLGITGEKIAKAQPQALALTADRLLNRAEAIEGRTTDLSAFIGLWKELGLAPSHSASRLTLEKKLTIETIQTVAPKPTA